MKNYNLKHVYDYIFGNDIEDYNIEELENDPNFMFLVLKKSRDKRMYELCSDNVKNNYSFVKNVIDLFEEDLDFASLVAENYLNSLSKNETEYSLSYKELNIIMTNKLGHTINSFSLRAAAFYETEKVRIAACMKALEADGINDNIGHGFLFSFAEYSDSEVVVDYIAKRMINETFYGDKDLEYLVHKSFKNLFLFEAYGEVNFLHRELSKYDPYLAEYTFGSYKEPDFINFFASVLKDIEKVKYKWSMYMDRLNAWRVSVFGYEVGKYLTEECPLGNLEYGEIATYVAKVLDVEDIFQKHDAFYEDSRDEEKYSSLEIADINAINKALSLANELFSSDIYDEELTDYERPKKYSTQVIRFQVADMPKNSKI